MTRSRYACWWREPSDARSGWRGSQIMGISEHFEFDLPPLSNFVKTNGVADFLYEPGAAEDDQWNGLWGLIRAYNGLRVDLQVVPNNTNGGRQDATLNVEDFNTDVITINATKVASLTASSLDTGTASTTSDTGVPIDETVETDFYTTGGTCTGTICVASVAPATTDSTAIAPTGTLTSDTLTVVSAGPTPAPGSRYSVCPKGAPVRSFDVSAISAANLPGGTLTYNSRATSVKGTIQGDETGPLQDPTAILYVRTSDLDTTT